MWLAYAHEAARQRAFSRVGSIPYPYPDAYPLPPILLRPKRDERIHARRAPRGYHAREGTYDEQREQ